MVILKKLYYDYCNKIVQLEYMIVNWDCFAFVDN